MFSGPQTFSQAVSGLRASKKQEAFTLPLPYRLTQILEVSSSCPSPWASGDLPVSLAGLVLEMLPHTSWDFSSRACLSQRPLCCLAGVLCWCDSEWPAAPFSSWREARPGRQSGEKALPALRECGSCHQWPWVAATAVPPKPWPLSSFLLILELSQHPPNQSLFALLRWDLGLVSCHQENTG